METMKITETALNTNKVIMPFDRPDIEYNVEKITELLLRIVENSVGEGIAK